MSENDAAPQKLTFCNFTTAQSYKFQYSAGVSKVGRGGSAILAPNGGDSPGAIRVTRHYPSQSFPPLGSRIVLDLTCGTKVPQRLVTDKFSSVTVYVTTQSAFDKFHSDSWILETIQREPREPELPYRRPQTLETRVTTLLTSSSTTLLLAAAAALLC